MISVVIPVLNEANTIGELLDYLEANSKSENISEVIVVDGGSTDGTFEILESHLDKGNHHTILLQSPKGRAIQMNHGAQKATGKVLYFLHADSLPPKGFDEYILKYLDKGFLAGCFKMKFDSNHPVLKISQWFTQFNLKFCRGGDQSLFVSKRLYEKLGGYNEAFSIYEDCEFINRIYDSDETKFAVMDDYITTSARRYRNNGTWKLQYHFAVIHIKKTLGASAQSLHSYYDKYIVS
ncbi:MAG: glycosyltransferase family 2 protein [Flavobacteriaceae bacterium]|nr:glycosyltransferase family 2 protein [Flavobacteriaceae bacterium]